MTATQHAPRNHRKQGRLCLKMNLSCPSTSPFVSQMIPSIEGSLPFAILKVLGKSGTPQDENALDVLASLLKHGAWPTPRQLFLVVSNVGFEPSQKCFLDAVCLAQNPFLVGMILSLQLADAGEFGNEGHQLVAARLQNEVEKLVLEIFERLPKTVNGFQEVDADLGGMKVNSMLLRGSDPSVLIRNQSSYLVKFAGFLVVVPFFCTQVMPPRPSWPVFHFIEFRYSVSCFL